MPVPLVVGVELPESVGDDALVVVAVGIELPESVEEDDVPMPLVVGTELPESIEEDVPELIGVVIEPVVGDEVGAVLVVLLHRGVTELIEVPKELELNVSEEPWVQAAKRANRRKMARHGSPPGLRINMTDFSGLTEIVRDRIGNDSYYKVGSLGKLNEMSNNE